MLLQFSNKKSSAEEKNGLFKGKLIYIPLFILSVFVFGAIVAYITENLHSLLTKGETIFTLKMVFSPKSVGIGFAISTLGGFVLLVTRGSFKNIKGLLGRDGGEGDVTSVLENSRYLTDAERDKFFPKYAYEELEKAKNDGVPVRALMDEKGRMNVNIMSGAHSLVVGSTGSGKTTTFVNPMIQIIGAAKKGRNVYFILDEFGNLPKIEKFGQMITVGRSRKIWFNMVIQSYAQLNAVYGEQVGDIVKSNCALKMFIGSNDINTCKEFSELCGNKTVKTASTSAGMGTKEGDINVSTSMQVRPLIYPSELQKMNNKVSTGNAVIVTFGNYPLKTKYTPSFKCPKYQFGRMSMEDLEGHVFKAEEVHYDIAKRNKIILEE